MRQSKIMCEKIESNKQYTFVLRTSQNSSFLWMFWGSATLWDRMKKMGHLPPTYAIFIKFKKFDSFVPLMRNIEKKISSGPKINHSQNVQL